MSNNSLPHFATVLSKIKKSISIEKFNNIEVRSDDNAYIVKLGYKSLIYSAKIAILGNEPKVISTSLLMDMGTDKLPVEFDKQKAEVCKLESLLLFCLPIIKNTIKDTIDTMPKKVDKTENEYLGFKKRFATNPPIEDLFRDNKKEEIQVSEVSEVSEVIPEVIPEVPEVIPEQIKTDTTEGIKWQ